MFVVALVLAMYMQTSAHAQNRWWQIADHEDDFSSSTVNSGSGGWRYGVYVTPTSSFNTNEFHGYNAYGTNQVGFGPAWWLSPDGDNGVGKFSMRPSRAQPGDYRWATTGWLSNFQGTVSVQSSFRKTSTAGDGVAFKVLKNSTSLFNDSIAGGNNGFNTHSVDNVSVAVGDRLSFTVGPNDLAGDNDIISFRAQGATSSSGYFRVMARTDPTLNGRVTGPVTVNEGSTVSFGIEADVLNPANPTNVDDPEFATRWRSGALSITRDGSIVTTQALNNGGGNGRHRSSVSFTFDNNTNTTIGFTGSAGSPPAWEMVSRTAVWDYGSPNGSLPVTVVNVPPQNMRIEPPDITINEGQSTNLKLLASDPGRFDDITFYLNGQPVGTDFTDTTGDRMVTVPTGVLSQTGADPQIYTYTTYARDGDNGQSQTVTGTVRVQNVAPTVNDIAGPQYLLLDQVGSWHVDASDPSDTLQYAWQLPGGLNPQSASGSNAGGTADQVGVYSINVSVSDGSPPIAKSKPVEFVAEVFWTGDVSGSYSDADRWLDSLVPQGRRITANFGSANRTANRSVNLDVDAAIGTLRFNSTNGFGYHISGAKTISLSGPSSLAIDVLGGSHIVDPTIVIQKSSEIYVAGGASLAANSLLDAGTNSILRSGTGLLAAKQLRAGATTISGGVVQLTGPTSASLITSLNLSGGKIDVASSFLEIDYSGASPGAAIRQAISSGAIYSSSIDGRAAVGWLDTARETPGTWPANPSSTSPDGSTIGITFTLRGDANLDRQVNFADLIVLSQNYNQSNREWADGDFNYDSVVNFTDLVFLAQNYNQGLLAASESLIAASDASSGFQSDWRLAVSLAPEPSTLLLGAVAATVAPRRQRRQVPHFALAR